jgi:hypothetical protein
LTSFEEEAAEGNTGHHRVEIVHESLLAAWPRLVRWQTQDADAAQLRDQLRQAAHIWNEHDRLDDLLWTGSAYREFAVWRERYPGGLSEAEVGFAAAMTSLATRRRKRRRIAAAVVTVFLVAVAVVLGTLWRQSVRETLRAEAAKLLALAEVQIETDPTEALAYAIASLDLADTNEGRVFTMRALSAGPPLRALVVGDTGLRGSFKQPVFSPNGRWLALTGFNNEYVLVFNEDGREPIVLDGHAVHSYDPIRCGWTRDGLLVTGHWTEHRVRIWEVPTGRLVRTIEFSKPSMWWVGNEHLMAATRLTSSNQLASPLRFRRWKLPGGPAEDLGSVGLPVDALQGIFDPVGNAYFYSRGDAVYRVALPAHPRVPDKLVTRHSTDGVTFDGVTWGFWQPGSFSAEIGAARSSCGPLKAE